MRRIDDGNNEGYEGANSDDNHPNLYRSQFSAVFRSRTGYKRCPGPRRGLAAFKSGIALRGSPRPLRRALGSLSGCFRLAFKSGRRRRLLNPRTSFCLLQRKSAIWAEAAPFSNSGMAIRAYHFSTFSAAPGRHIAASRFSWAILL